MKYEKLILCLNVFKLFIQSYILINKIKPSTKISGKNIKVRRVLWMGPIQPIEPKDSTLHPQVSWFFLKFPQNGPRPAGPLVGPHWWSQRLQPSDEARKGPWSNFFLLVTIFYIISFNFVVYLIPDLNNCVQLTDHQLWCKEKLFEERKIEVCISFSINKSYLFSSQFFFAFVDYI